VGGDIDDPSQVMTYNPKSGGLWGRTGAAIDQTVSRGHPLETAITTKSRKPMARACRAKVIDGALQLQDYYMR